MAFYDFKVKRRKDQGELDLASLKGKVVLVVNTATGCGFTPQYEGLEKLYEAYHDQGFEILDFPCNQFMGQAPGSDDKIHEFCTAKYKTQFDQLAKIKVNGEDEEPLYTFLKAAQPKDNQIIGSKFTAKLMKFLSKSTKKDSDIKWNFTKFLVNKEGEVVNRFSPDFTPEKIEDEIKALLK